MKHAAAAQGSELVIDISLAKLSAKEGRLQIKDNGLHSSQPHAAGLGTKIVSSLVNQLRGAIYLRVESGLTATITFPL
jgi:two-component sensor histidine kinase